MDKTLEDLKSFINTIEKLVPLYGISPSDIQLHSTGKKEIKIKCSKEDFCFITFVFPLSLNRVNYYLEYKNANILIKKEAFEKSIIVFFERFLGIFSLFGDFYLEEFKYREIFNFFMNQKKNSSYELNFGSHKHFEIKEKDGSIILNYTLNDTSKEIRFDLLVF